ncbi:hypothetical protein [Dendronalium sp. ChiSLP03b]|uniref:hypothetical protein n=1 Tax=Dendronalium sp. ChiSLP03b TaxID=3075381 RepID=UPI002AD58E98|nr:hypothetical protein [Dendronalium sp. ChiSLP03b]MDZ8207456.1 hypothetical protein [Dendronalium sp. ChiSLP03b]
MRNSPRPPSDTLLPGGDAARTRRASPNGSFDSTGTGATSVLGFHASPLNGGNPRTRLAPQVQEVASKTPTSSPRLL